MAEQSQQSRTEQPTPRRLEKARQKGQVAYSTDLTGGAMLLAGSLCLALFRGWWGQALDEKLTYYLRAIRWCGGGTTDQWIDISRQAIEDTATLSLPIILTAFAASLGAGGLLTGFRMTAETLKPDVGKLDPRKGFSRLFSTRSVVRGGLAIAKLIALSSLVLVIIHAHLNRIGDQSLLPFTSAVTVGTDICIQIMIAVSAALLALGLIDLLYQKCLEKAVPVHHPIGNRDYQMRDFDVIDPDGHIIEVGESMEHVAYRLSEEGKSLEEISNITYMPIEVVNQSIEKYR